MSATRFSCGVCPKPVVESIANDIANSNAFFMGFLNLTKIYVNVIGRSIARIVHLLHPPVFAFARDRKCIFTVAYTRLAIVNVTYAHIDLAAKAEFLCVYRRDHTINAQIVAARPAPAFLFAL